MKDSYKVPWLRMMTSLINWHLRRAGKRFIKSRWKPWMNEWEMDTSWDAKLTVGFYSLKLPESLEQRISSCKMTGKINSALSRDTDVEKWDQSKINWIVIPSCYPSGKNFGSWRIYTFVFPWIFMSIHASLTAHGRF